MKRVMKKDLMKFVFLIGIIFIFALIIKMPFLSGVDTVPPNVTSLSPSNNTQTSEHSVTFSGELNDDVGLSDAIFNLYSSDGNLYATRTANYNSSSITFLQISADSYFSCGVLTNGSGMCWGINSYGQLGINNTLTKSVPTPVYGNYIFSSISAGSSHTCGLLQNGTALCWGRNMFGELGNNLSDEEGDLLSTTVPNSVYGNYNFSSVYSGMSHTCGLLQNGTALCWGYSPYLGIDYIPEYESNINFPTPVYGNYNFSSISVGYSHTCGLLQNGTALCWGYNGAGQIGNNSNITAILPTPVYGNYNFSKISAGSGVSCGVLVNHSALCWGDNYYGQIGNGSKGGFKTIPSFVNGSYNFSDISTEVYHACGILTNGLAMCWGWDYDNVLGDNGVEEKYSPVYVSGGYNFSKISTGEFHNCGVLTNNYGLCWGNNGMGQLGDDSIVWRTVPYPVVTNNSFSSISAGSSSTCGILTNGSGMCWGSNTKGQLGDNTTLLRKLPTFIIGNYNFSYISKTHAYTCGVLTNGSGMCWGYNGAGQIGNNATVDTLIPTPVYGNYNFSLIETGSSHACGLLQNGTALCWGTNGEGRLGNGSTGGKSLVPTPVYGNYNFSYLECGIGHTCGLLQNGTALCWGYNLYGQMGNGSILNGDVPTPVYGNYNFSSISTGNSLTCGLLQNGTALCWGYNGDGELGSGFFDGQSKIPITVYGNYNFSSLSVGSSPCGLLQNGTALCWGYNLYGQMGNGSILNGDVPTPVYGNYNFSSISPGYSHTCGLLQNGTALCWGYAYSGQLGDNTTSRMNIPTFVYARIIFSNTINLVDGLYYWLINVFDRIGNNYNTGNYTLTVYTSVTAETPSGGSSAVTSNPVYVPSALKESFWTQTTVVMESNWEEVAQPVLTEDTQQPITEEEAISLEQELLNELKTNPDAEIQEIAIKEFSENLSVTERLKITEKNTTAYIGVARISGDSAVVQVSSGGGGGGTVQKVMKLGETQSFDLNGDGLNDIRITLMKIDPKLRVGVKIAVIYNGLLPAKEIPEYEKEQKSNKLLILSLVVVGFLIVVTVFLRFRKFK